MAVASKAGGAEPNGATRPSIHSGSPAVAAGMASAPVLTVNAPATGSVAGEVPLPVKVNALAGHSLMACRSSVRAPVLADTSEPQRWVGIRRTEPVLLNCGFVASTVITPVHGVEEL